MRKVILCLGIFAGSVISLMADQVHVVQKNETLGGIALRYGVSVSTLQAYNGISNPTSFMLEKT